MGGFLVLILVILILLFGLFAIEIRNRLKADYRAAISYPGSKFYPIIGSLMQVICLNREETFLYVRKQATKFQSSYREYVIGRVILNAIRAKDVEKIISSSKHSGKSLIYKFLQPFLGEGLLTSKGVKWQNRRKILTPAFHFNILQQFLLIFREESENLIKSLNKIVEKDDGINIIPLVTKFTLNTICETAMGVRLDETDEGEKYRQNIYLIGEQIVFRLLRPWLHSKFIFNLLGYQKSLKKLLKPVHEFSRNIINLRRSKFFENERLEQRIDIHQDNIYETTKQRFAMLDTLLAAEKEGFISQEGIQEEVDTFMFEGHDTTSSSLTMTLLLLAHHPEVQEKILEEVWKMREETGNYEKLAVADYNKLKYLDRVIKESLRLYPSVSFISRTLSEDLELDGVIFPKWSMVFIHIYDLHRDPEQFPDPEKFDPDRFLPENIAKRHPFAYIPFSAGPRNCIGQKFAILEMKSMLVEILQNFELIPITKREEIVFVADIVLRSKNPIKVKFIRRQNRE